MGRARARDNDCLAASLHVFHVLLIAHSLRVGAVLASLSCAFALRSRAIFPSAVSLLRAASRRAFVFACAGGVLVVLSGCDPQGLQVGSSASSSPLGQSVGSQPATSSQGSGAAAQNNQEVAPAAESQAVLDLISDIPIPPQASLIPSPSLVLGRGEKWTGRIRAKICVFVG